MFNLIIASKNLTNSLNKHQFLIDNKHMLLNHYDLEKIKQSLTYLKNSTFIETDFELPNCLEKPLDCLKKKLENLIRQFYCSYF